ncbi:MAG: hydrogenase nickel incorporation protein HypB [Armatimonadota bacterium]|nr:hydrogenase nickel incorporation protein HypB [Armatimonadota bacterium]
MRRIEVVSSVLTKNAQAAAETRARLNAAGVTAVNVMSAPGSGKTTLLQQTLQSLPDIPAAVLVGDLQTTRDAERLAATGAPIVQINTGRGCHLTADQVAEGVAQLNLNEIRLLFIENVGNMVCPTGVDLGEHLRVALLSVPEGDDKVAKYPTLFQGADLILLTKVDLLPVLPFETGRVQRDLAQVNTRAPLLFLSTTSGAGMAEWLSWLRQQVRGESCP